MDLEGQVRVEALIRALKADGVAIAVANRRCRFGARMGRPLSLARGGRVSGVVEATSGLAARASEAPPVPMGSRGVGEDTRMRRSCAEKSCPTPTWRPMHFSPS